MCIMSEEQESFCQWASDYVPKKHGLSGCFELWAWVVGRAQSAPPRAGTCLGFSLGGDSFHPLKWV